MAHWWNRLWRHLKRRFGKDDSFVSVVAFLNQPRELKESDLREAAERAWHVTFESGENKQNFVAITGPIQFVKVQGHIFQLLVSANPYGHRREEFAKTIRDLRLRRIILEHKAWFSVDYMGGGPDGMSAEQKHLASARLAAELLEQDCMGIYLPAKGWIVASRADLAERLRNLRSLKSLEQLGRAPVLEFSDEDAAAASRTARVKWPEFLAAFGEGFEGDEFFVKKRFAEAGEVEFMWVRVSEIDTDRIFGVLDSDPSALTKPKRGDGMHLQAPEVEDWCYIRQGKVHGAFLKP